MKTALKPNLIAVLWRTHSVRILTLFSCFAASLFSNFAQAQTDSLRTDSLKIVNIIQACSFPKDYTNVICRYPHTMMSALGVPTVGQEPAYLFQTQPNVSITSDAGAYNGYTYIRVRGIDQTRLNFSLNGVPIQEGEDQGMYFSNFPDLLQDMSEVSIINGSGTLYNGAPSFGGSVALASKRLSDATGGSVYANYGSFNTYRIGAAYNTGIKNKFGASVRTGYVGSDNYKQHSGHQGYSTTASLGYFGTKDVVRFTVLLGTNKNQMSWLGAPLDSIERNPRYNANSAAEKDNFTQAHAQLHYTHFFSDSLISTISLYDNFNKGFYTFDYDNFTGAGSDNGAYQYNFAANGVGGILHLKALFKNLDLHFNLHGSTYSRQHIGTFNPAGDTLYQNTGKKGDVSAAFQGTYRLQKWRFRAGLQMRHASFDYKGDVFYPTKQWNFLNPNIAIAYILKPNELQLYSRFSVTNREPMRNDLFGGNDNLAVNADSTVGVDLQPETMQDLEIGIQYNKNNFSGKLNAYYMQFQNEIALNGAFGPTGLPLHVSAAQTVRTGVEFELNYGLNDGFSLQHNSNFSLNETNDLGLKFQPVLTPQIIINQGFMYKKNINSAWNWSAALSLRYQSQSYLDFANTVKLPAAYTADARASLTYKRFDFTLQARNLLNQRYYGSGSIGYDGTPLYFIQAPFNMMGGLAWRF
jgi:iron complex outermembrane recepter protein